MNSKHYRLLSNHTYRLAKTYYPVVVVPSITVIEEVLGSGLKNLPTSGKLNHTAAENQNQSQPENSNKTTAFSSNQLSFQLPIAISGLLKSREMDVLPLPL